MNYSSISIINLFLKFETGHLFEKKDMIHIFERVVKRPKIKIMKNKTFFLKELFSRPLYHFYYNLKVASFILLIFFGISCNKSELSKERDLIIEEFKDLEKRNEDVVTVDEKRDLKHDYLQLYQRIYDYENRLEKSDDRKKEHISKSLISSIMKRTSKLTKEIQNDE